MSEREEATGVPYRDGYVQIRGARLHYVDYGGDGEALVALHGFTGTAHVFDSIAPVLVPHVRLIALNRRGRGGSDWSSPANYKPRQSMIDLIQFLAALELKRFALIGTSQGGAIARMYAFAHPDRVTRLVLNDSLLPTDRAAAESAAKRPLRICWRGWPRPPLNLPAWTKPSPGSKRSAADWLDWTPRRGRPG